jgi:hypothetical protein
MTKYPMTKETQMTKETPMTKETQMTNDESTTASNSLRCAALSLRHSSFVILSSLGTLSFVIPRLV